MKVEDVGISLSVPAHAEHGQPMVPIEIQLSRGAGDGAPQIVFEFGALHAHLTHQTAAHLAVALFGLLDLDEAAKGPNGVAVPEIYRAAAVRVQAQARATLTKWLEEAPDGA